MHFRDRRTAETPTLFFCGYFQGFSAYRTQCELVCWLFAGRGFYLSSASAEHVQGTARMFLIWQ